MKDRNYVPKSQQIHAVADVFARAASMFDDPIISMYCTEAYQSSYTCKTFACHGGWYAVGKTNFSAEIKKSKIDGKILRDDSSVIYYCEGAMQLAHDLGFSCRNSLEEWAGDNAALWGGKRGNQMFVSGDAFNNMIGVKDSPRFFETWWRKVAWRVEATEKKTNAEDA